MLSGWHPRVLRGPLAGHSHCLLLRVGKPQTFGSVVNRNDNQENFISIDNELATLILEGLVLKPIANPTDELHAAMKSVYITHADVEVLLLLLNLMNDLQGFYGS